MRHGKENNGEENYSKRDDDQFARHLKEFRPLLPAPLPISAHAPKTRPLVVAAWAGALAAILTVALLARSTHRPGQATLPESPDTETANSSHPPLTLGSANALLAASPSFRSALDDVNVKRSHLRESDATRSVIAVLSKEKIQ
jgi:hypothetical protein